MTGIPTATLTTDGRRALRWARYCDHPDGPAALAEARKMADQLAGLPHLTGWSFVVRGEPEQRRVTVVGTAPRPSAVS